MGWWAIGVGEDAAKFDPDGPLPEIPESNASKSGRERAIALAKRENLTVRQLAQRLGGYAGLAMVGTPQTIADEMQEWLETRGSDGFTIMFPYLPGGLDDFVDRVVPELQRRGIFRREYEGKTLRENLGLPRPSNRFFRHCSGPRGPEIVEREERPGPRRVLFVLRFSAPAPFWRTPLPSTRNRAAPPAGASMPSDIAPKSGFRLPLPKREDLDET